MKRKSVCLEGLKITSNETSIKAQAALAVTVVLIAFPLHFVWEYVQCPIFYRHDGMPLTPAAMVGATIGDLFLTGLAFVFVALISRDLSWITSRWTTLHWVAMEVIALVLSIVVEKIGLRLNRWSYLPITPILPIVEISLLPVLQLMILFPLTFWLTRWLTFRMDGRGWLTALRQRY
jgi:hypothetical protein